MQVNFFFIAASGVLDGQPASYITNFHLSSLQGGVVRDLVAAFPNVSVIDVDALLAQVAHFAGRLTTMVRFVFGFAVLAGGVVLLAAQQATHDERAYEIAILRSLGARNRQVRQALLTEIFALSAVAVILANGVALGIAWALARFVFESDFVPDLMLLALSGVVAVAVILGASWLGVRRVLFQPAIERIRAI